MDSVQVRDTVFDLISVGSLGLLSYGALGDGLEIPVTGQATPTTPVVVTSGATGFTKTDLPIFDHLPPTDPNDTPFFCFTTDPNGHADGFDHVHQLVGITAPMPLHFMHINAADPNNPWAWHVGLTGDFDLDGDVDLVDYMHLTVACGRMDPNNPLHKVGSTRGDLNLDILVDAADYAILFDQVTPIDGGFLPAPVSATTAMMLSGSGESLLMSGSLSMSASELLTPVAAASSAVTSSIPAASAGIASTTPAASRVVPADGWPPAAMVAMLAEIIRTNERDAILTELQASAAAAATDADRAWYTAVVTDLQAIW